MQNDFKTGYPYLISRFLGKHTNLSLKAEHGAIKSTAYTGNNQLTGADKQPYLSNYLKMLNLVNYVAFPIVIIVVN